MKTQRVVFTGAVLARLYATCAETNAPFDGLLFGSTSSYAKDVYDDAQEAVSHEDSVTMVTNAICSASMCSFYDGAGKVNYAKLTHLEDQCRDPLIGWFAFHTEPFKEPSHPHKMVTHALARHSTGGLTMRPFPNLFCLLSLNQEHSDATISFQYKAYLSVDAHDFPDRISEMTAGRLMMPLPVEILHVGDARGEERYTALLPSSYNFMAQNLDENQAMSLISTMEGVPHEPLRSMIRSLQKQCAELLEEYERNVAHVRTGSQEVHRLKAELARLKTLRRP